ncbi:MAG: hypothetical protein ABR548_09840 [Actinomycetota bacterium]|nr:hypothetical protein [Actinomycetota bacterium]
MRTHQTNRVTDPVAAVSALANEAASRGLRPPLQLAGRTGTTRGWELLRRHGDVLIGDEYGELLWGRPQSACTVGVVRPCWPEEIASYASAITERVEQILNA